MSKYITVSALGYAEPLYEGAGKGFSFYAENMKKVIKEEIEKVLLDCPDLIVLPEASNRYRGMSVEDRKEYYKYVGEDMREYLQKIAKENNVNIAYSAERYIPSDEEKPFRNSTQYIDRKGEVAGIYDKNFLVYTEYEDADKRYSDKAETIDLDFGKVASAICFDLNFDELIEKYKKQNPDLIVFSSMYHGGLRQAQWAYACRSYFVGAVCGNRCTVLNPFGDIIASSTNYNNYVSAKINLDSALCHIDFNMEKIMEAKKKYKDALNIYDPGHVGSLLLSSESPDVTVKEIIDEFEIELLDDYFTRSRKHRLENLNG